MELKRIPYRLTVCKVADISVFDINNDFYFIGKTDEEVSLVCRTEDAPSVTIERDEILSEVSCIYTWISR